MQLLDHPHVLSLHCAWETLDTSYLIMDFCNCGDLFGYLHPQGRPPNPLTEVEAMPLMQQLLSAVLYMHECSVCHRDMKPENILLSAPGLLKIMDFGQACFCDDSMVLVDKKVGTRWFRAPEIRAGAYNKMCDMWSMGVILHEILLGTPELLPSIEYRVLWSAFGRLSGRGKDILRQLRTEDPDLRLTAARAVSHPWCVTISL
eukprot:gnl/MRDRNA2_/MRDRNA2_322227_c0_seq1.p1 gnl/MRDRNA2_/MRDRNA2_322227_c0~~gnl/MRDRNA2_/MRDRNA2_322227_c0_seq1.p1  ORF type:complete len:203 (-),score=17.89 gnl/MRDRNA2_/MRDRNA2_322227_c0_seq1:411-1019(-)